MRFKLQSFNKVEVMNQPAYIVLWDFANLEAEIRKENSRRETQSQSGKNRKGRKK
jgi:hypothetical protein